MDRHWLAGAYDHALDSKFRVSLPAPLRKTCKAMCGGGRLEEFFAFHEDDCVFLVPAAIMEERVAPFRRLSQANPDARNAIRIFFSRITPIHVDSQGRVLDYVAGNRCAAGTVEFFKQQLGRMNLTIEEGTRLADSGKVVPLAKRCSVHCKT